MKHTLSAVAILMLATHVDASSIYSEESGWRILEIHENFSNPRRHSHCTAFKSLGDQTLFIDVSREYVENANMTQNTLILRYFDNSLNETESSTISLLIDGALITEASSAGIKQSVSTSNERRIHDPYSLSLVDINSASLNLRSDGNGKTYIDNSPAGVADKDAAGIIPGIQANLNIEQHKALVNQQKVLQDGGKNIQFGPNVRPFPMDGFTKALSTAIECNRNFVTVEYTLAQNPNIVIADPYEVLIQQGLPNTEDNTDTFISRLDELAKLMAPSLANGSSTLLDGEELSKLNLPLGTLNGWKGPGSDGYMYYNSYVFDNLRQRRLSGFYEQCIGSGGFARLTGNKQANKSGLVYNQQLFSCGRVNGDPTLNTYHFLTSIHSEVDGSSIGIEDSIISQMNEVEAETTWTQLAAGYPELKAPE